MLSKAHILTRAGLVMGLFVACGFAQKHYIVDTPTGNITDICKRTGLQFVAALGGSAHGMYVVNSALSLDSVVQALSQEPSVRKVEEDSPLSLPETSKTASLKPASLSLLALTVKQGDDTQGNDGAGNSAWSAYLTQPAATMIKVKQAHDSVSGAGIVAVLDTGIDMTHPVLKNSVIWGYDFINKIPGGQAEPVDVNQSTTSILDQSTTSILDQSTTSILDGYSTLVLDQSTTSILDQSTTSILDQSTTSILDSHKPINDWGHGTMVAGLIHLVAPNAKLMPVKVFDAKGGSSVSLIVQGIHYAVDNGAHVINMSFSMAASSQTLKDAIDWATSQGVVLVAAAGNEGASMTVYPAGYTAVIGVGATDNNYQRASFSNYGPVVDLAAPGVWVITTYPMNQYAAGSGTSFSAPMMAGAASLFLQLNSSIDPAGTLKAADYAHPLNGQQLGAGLLDLLLACNSLNNH